MHFYRLLADFSPLLIEFLLLPLYSAWLFSTDIFDRKTKALVLIIEVSMMDEISRRRTFKNGSRTPCPVAD